jgi:deazaflavin-dependent oxidoreductase (nitroreductase family)
MAMANETADKAPRSASKDRGFVRFGRSALLVALFRAPVWLYRLRLGWLLGHRALLLTHRGRKSGRRYQTVLEVVHYDPVTRESVVVSGWGKRADWYQNIRASPAIEVRTGRSRYVPSYRELTPEESYQVVGEYVRRRPRLLRPIVRWLGFSIDGTEDARRAHAGRLLLLGFRPRPQVELARAPQLASTAHPS